MEEKNLNIPKEKFEFYQRESIHDKRLDTKPVGFFKDAMIRFSRNKSSVVAAYIILAIVLFAIFVPWLGENNYTKAATDTTYLQYAKLYPKSHLFKALGWDGCTRTTISTGDYNLKMALVQETGYNPIVKIYDTYEDTVSNSTMYDVRLDSYINNGMIFLTLTEEEYTSIQKWQDENNIQVIYPAVDSSSLKVATLKNNANIWFACTNKGLPKLDKNGNLTNIYKKKGNDEYNSIRIDGDDGSYRYALIGGTSTAKSYTVRVFTYTYFQYRYGFEPCFVFGTNAYGQDIFTRLAKGARFSLTFALCISVVNITLGILYGSVEGYYGGAADMVMERVSDIISGVPFITSFSLFQLHLQPKLNAWGYSLGFKQGTFGAIAAFFLAYIATGWIGPASSVRMQFYRFKNHEYILAARTLGAKDSRLMFKHILPNGLGTLVTRFVLIIPGAISGEANLTYLGIINLDSSTRSSIGSMLSAGRSMVSTYPHVILFPALVISLLMISFNLFGNGLRDAFNPSLRGTEG